MFKILVVAITLYGWADNTPPGPSLEYPIIHQTAGGAGTFQDPISFAAEPKQFKPGTKIYVPRLRKYFIMEDWCESAHRKYTKKKGLPLIDLWIGGTEKSNRAELLEAENDLSQTPDVIYVNPPDNLEVDNDKLFGE